MALSIPRSANQINPPHTHQKELTGKQGKTDLSTKFHNKKSYNKYVNRISWNTTWHLSDTTPDPPGMVQVGNSSLQLFPCDQLLLDVWWRVLPSHSRCPHLLHWQAPQVDVHLHWLGSAKSACLQTHLSFSFTGLPVLPKCLFVGIPFPIIVAWTLGKLYYDNEKWVCRSLVEIKKKKDCVEVTEVKRQSEWWMFIDL